LEANGLRLQKDSRQIKHFSSREIVVWLIEGIFSRGQRSDEQFEHRSLQQHTPIQQTLRTVELISI
jgi:hypothetical protein